MLKKISSLVLLLSSFGLAQNANATLIGDSIGGSLGSDAGNTVTTPFSSPVVVGAGVEFSGVITDVFQQVWTIDVDFSASSLTVAISESTRNGDGNISNGVDLLDLYFDDLDWVGSPGVIAGVVMSDYSCSPAGFACNTFGGGPNLSVLDFGSDWIDISMDVMRHGEVYTFDIITRHVPEPGVVALMALGLAGFGFSRRNRA